MTNSARRTAAPEPARGRGRPKKSPLETEQLRNRIKKATAVVYGEHGHHGVSVELILQEAGLSRPTFYRYFRNVNDALDEVLAEVNEQLIQQVSVAIHQAPSPIEKIDAGLMAWRRWGEGVGPILRPIFSELYDKASPNHPHRLKVLDAVTQELQSTAQQIGRPPFGETQLDAFLFGIEHLGYRYHFGPKARTEAAWQETRQAMIRLAVGMLGSTAEWAVAPQIAMTLGVALD